MTFPVAVERRARLPLHRRPLPLLAVGVARLLTRAQPRRIRVVLEFVRRGAAPATTADALAARSDVVAVSLRCAGQVCVERSIAAALLCRARGVWPTWCTGVRTAPFMAHAWIQVDGNPVGEPYPAGHYQPMIVVPPRTPGFAA